ncbi:MAG: hypothetical protein FWG97_04595 [Deltaproteobacteria bacterium]|nr:hypothetical protein [Deltaproteobacteria bacterium]
MDGIPTVGSEAGVHFDHDGNLFAERTGWMGRGGALLAWDRNQNGRIDDGGELFGSQAPLASGRKWGTGFQALVELDSNRDDIIDQRDENWPELRLWIDHNGDGLTDEGELMTLEEAGVIGLSLDYVLQNDTDENGNLHYHAATFIKADGSTGRMTEVWFKTDFEDTLFLDELDEGMPGLFK